MSPMLPNRIEEEELAAVMIRGSSTSLVLHSRLNLKVNQSKNAPVNKGARMDCAIVQKHSKMVSKHGVEVVWR